MNQRSFTLFALSLTLVLSGRAFAERIEVPYVAQVATSSGTPFGASIAFGTEVTGIFVYETTTADTNLDPDRGDYPHSDGDFRAEVAGTSIVITGSATPFVETEDFDPDTFRFIDGPRTSGNAGGVMSVNGVQDTSVELSIVVTDAAGNALVDDGLPAPFAFDMEALPHTFSLRDSGGTLLLQIVSVVSSEASSWGQLKAKLSVDE